MVVGLDKTDLRILAALEENSRQPNKAIARKLGINEHVIAYRIQKMLDSGKIRKIYCSIRRGVFYNIGYRTFLRFQSISPENEKEIISRLQKCEFVNWVANCRGRFDLVFSMFVKDPATYNKAFQEAVQGFEEFIQEKEILNFLEMKEFNRKYFNNAEPFEMNEYSGKFETSEMDGLDWKIVRILSENSRVSAIEIAKSLAISPDTVRNRIKSLEKSKIILGHGVLLDFDKTGLKEIVVLLNLRNVPAKREKQLKDFAKQHPNIIYWGKFVGTWDVDFEMEIEENKIDDFITELRSKFGDIIKNIEVLTIVKDFKYTHMARN